MSIALFLLAASLVVWTMLAGWEWLSARFLCRRRGHDPIWVGFHQVCRRCSRDLVVD